MAVDEPAAVYDPVVAEVRALVLTELAAADVLARIAHWTEQRPERLTARRLGPAATRRVCALARTNLAQRGAEIEAAARDGGVSLADLRGNVQGVWTLMARHPVYGAQATWRHPWEAGRWP